MFYLINAPLCSLVCGKSHGNCNRLLTTYYWKSNHSANWSKVRVISYYSFLLWQLCRETGCTVCTANHSLLCFSFRSNLFIYLFILALLTSVLRLRKTRLTLWQVHCNPLWHCDCSHPGKLQIAPTGIQNQSPHGSLTNHLSIPTHVICTKVKHNTGGIGTTLNMALCFCREGGYHPALQAGLYL